MTNPSNLDHPRKPVRSTNPDADASDIGTSVEARCELIKINGVLTPKLSQNHRDRGLTCQEALEPCFQACVAAADASGWDGDEAAFALLHLSLAHLKARRVSLATAEAINPTRNQRNRPA